MANVQNLIPQSHILTSEEKQKGGIASGISRRRKAICNKLLNHKITKAEAKEQLLKYGIEEDEHTELAISMYDLLGESRNKSNTVRDRLLALRMFMEYAESDQIQSQETPKVQIEVVDNSNLEKVLYESDT